MSGPLIALIFGILLPILAVIFVVWVIFSIHNLNKRLNEIEQKLDKK